MNKPKTFADGKLRTLWLELTVLFALTTFATVHFTDLHWTVAMFTAPVLMAVLLSLIGVFVQTLWMLVLGMEKVSTCIGLRKTPLV